MAQQIVQKAQMMAKRYIPVVRVSFHTETACYQATGEFVGFSGQPDPTNQVLSVSTQKSLASPAGAFTIQLQGEEWLFKLTPNDMVVIQMGYKTSKGLELDTVMVGLIDRPTRSRMMGSDGMPNVGVTVTGRDFGKVLLKSELKFYPQIGQAQANKENKFFLVNEGWIALLSFFTSDKIMKGTPDVILDNIMRYLLPKLFDVQWTVWDENKDTPTAKMVHIGNVLRYIFAKVPMFMPMGLTADQFEGALWNLMERATIKPFSELFIDVRPTSEAWNTDGTPMVVNEAIGHTASDFHPPDAKNPSVYPSEAFHFGLDKSVVALFFRSTPFNRDMWNKLKAHNLEAEDVKNETLSFSDDEHYNLFWAGTQINPLGLDMKSVNVPLLHEKNAKRYGLSPLEVTIEGLDLVPGSDQDKEAKKATLIDRSKEWTAKLRAWFGDNHTYLSGSMSVRGKGGYKIGQRLVREGIGLEFYIESVTQNFTVFTEWETALELTRGMPIGSAPNYEWYM